jgi:PhzF family phenazine biosynthesis protein
MPPVRIFQVDAFTTQRFAGNPAAVVLDADGLDDTQMRALARELHHGDSAFVLAPDGSDHDLRVRFFTPRGEIGFVGHATVAVHSVLAALGLPPRPRQKQRTGIVQVSAASQPNAAPLIGIRQSAPVLGRQLAAAELAAVLQAVRLPPEALDARLPPCIAGEASTRALLALRDGSALAQLQPELPRLAALSGALGAAGYFFFTLHPAVGDCDTEARMFCPALGIDEDPVSGNAHGMLGAYLFRHGLLPVQDARVHFDGAQGHHLGRPGRVTVTLVLEAGRLRYVEISGTAVIVFETRVQF